MKNIKEFILENNNKYYIESFYLDDKFNYTTDIYDFVSKYLPNKRDAKIWAIHIMAGYSIDDYKNASKIMNSNKKELGVFDDPQAKLTAYQFADGINGVFIEYKPRKQQTISCSLLLANSIGEVLRSI